MEIQSKCQGDGVPERAFGWQFPGRLVL